MYKYTCTNIYTYIHVQIYIHVYIYKCIYIYTCIVNKVGRDSVVGIAARYELEGPGVESPIPVAARSKAWVCIRSLAGIVGSNPTGGMDVCVVLDVWTVA